MAVQLEVFGFVHHTHPAATELREDSVMRNRPPNQRVGTRHSAAILGCGLNQVNEQPQANRYRPSKLQVKNYR